MTYEEAVKTSEEAHQTSPAIPPAPPLPNQKPSVLQRFIGPLAFSRPSQRESVVETFQSNSASPKDVGSYHDADWRPLPRTASHKTNLSIAAIDINDAGTHAVVAGQDVLQTVRVEDHTMHEDVNIRGSVQSFMSGMNLAESNQRREFLPARDVRWGHGLYSNLIATAANGGRVALWDVSRMGSRVEKHRFYSHKNSVNKIDFDPHSGQLLLSGSQDKTVQIWDLKDLDRNSGPSFQFPEQAIRAAVRDVRWCPTDIMFFALCTEEGTILKFDIRNNRQPVLSVPRAHEKKCYTIQWHPDGKHLASGGLDKNLKIWDISGTQRVKKPLLQLKCPANIMNVAWRPPCWSEESAGRGCWQSTQIATSYNKDDPRIHVWDLRRQYIPFRELSYTEHRPHDILWKDKDLLWSAGEAGVLVQNDVSHAPHPEDLLRPCLVEIGPDNTIYTVLDDRSKSRRRARGEPAAKFLNIPAEDLSNADENPTSRSVTDDEGPDALEHPRGSSQRPAKSTGYAQTATRSSLARYSATPQTNTPLTREDKPTMPLDRAIQAKKEVFFVNGQRFTISKIPGLIVPRETITTLIEGLARPSTARDREADPNAILGKLHEAFVTNTNLCNKLDLKQFANLWEQVNDIVMPELSNWANFHRRRRYESFLETNKEARKEQRQRGGDDHGQKDGGAHDDHDDNTYNRSVHQPSGPESKNHERNSSSSAQSVGKPNPMLSRLSQDDAKRTLQDSHYGSNVTTPRQLPLTDSPRQSKAGTTWFTVPETIDPITPLPASLEPTRLTFAAQDSHQTDLMDLADSSLSSSDSSRPLPSHAKKPPRQTRPLPTEMSTKPAAQELPLQNIQIPLSSKLQQDRRAALRDYRVPQKQPFSLEPSLSDAPSRDRERHDSTESYAFPASMSSSAKFKDLGPSFEMDPTTPEDREESPSRKNSDVWEPSEACYDSVGRSSQSDPHVRSGGSQGHFMPFGLDGASDSKPARPATRSAALRQVEEAIAKSTREKVKKNRERTQPNAEPTKVPKPVGPLFNQSSSDHIVHLPSEKATVPPPGSAHHRRNRWNRIQQNPVLSDWNKRYSLELIADDDQSLKFPYVIEDFRPIDVTTYDPAHMPFAMSTYARISVLIETDINDAKMGNFLSANVLAHLLPFFWHPSFRRSPSRKELSTARQLGMAEKLISPAFSTRVIEAIFADYIKYISQHQLVCPERAFRNFAGLEADFPDLLTSQWAVLAEEGESVGDRLENDPYAMVVTCSHCHAVMPLHEVTCKACGERRSPCAVCEQPLTEKPLGAKQSGASSGLTLILICQQCGHGGHTPCIQTWFEEGGCGGICPVPGCFHDCVPGPAQDARLAQNEKEKEQQAAVKSSLPSASTRLQSDPLRAGPSPAVDKARDTLRKSSSLAKEGVQSGDDHTPSSGGGSAWSRGTSFGRKVRIQEPGKETE